MTFFIASPGTVPVYVVSTSSLLAPPRTLSPLTTSVVAGSSVGKPASPVTKPGRVGRVVLRGIDVLVPLGERQLGVDRRRRRR